MTDLNALALDRLYATLAGGGLVRRVLELAREEDLGAGDITSEVCIAPGAAGVGHIVARAAGTIAGLAVIPDLLEVWGADLRLTPLARDGQNVEREAPLARLEGSLRDLLAVERTALNLVGRMSGIATLTSAFVRAACSLGPTRAEVYDTRKTTPGLRVLEKYAVRCGGGRCHRMGLHDAVLIKDNHLAGVPVSDLPAVVAEASRRARLLSPGLGFVEVEVDTLDQLRAILSLEPGTVDIVLLDNMDLGDLRRAVAMRDASPGRPQLEASGGVRLETVAQIAQTGVERISSGALTHSAAALDVALDITDARGLGA